MARLEVSKKKKSPRPTELSQLKKEVQRLTEQLKSCQRERAEATEQQAATSQILRVIASSPIDLQRVLDTVIANAVKLAGATQGHIRQYDGEFLRVVAHYGETPEQVALLQSRPIRAVPENRFGGRVLFEKKPIQVLDAQAEPTSYPLALQRGARTLLGVPLLREGTPIGAITIWRNFVDSFTEQQIELVKTFADQAVIAIENVRLFKELRERNAELREALEHQTATGEVLSIISRSPTDVQPVLDAIVESAARVCGIDDVVLRLREGSALIPQAHFGSVPPDRVEVSIDALHIRWMGEHGALHVPDVRAQNDFPTLGRGRGWRTLLAAPLRQQGELIGLLAARRNEVRPFTPAQIKLLETFADQAVIAIENVRLFQELKEALEQQTATSEVLKVISRSTFDLEPVLQTLLENATRLCGAAHGSMLRVEGDLISIMATYGQSRELDDFLRQNPPRADRKSVAGRVVLQRQAVHIPDLMADPEYNYGARFFEARTTLGVPLLREGVPIGVIIIFRTEVEPFTAKQIELVTTFADQAVIAIENVRLFNELKESLEQQTATSEILGVIASSPTDIQPVLDTIAESAARICGADDAFIRLIEANLLHLRAHYGQIKPEPAPRPIDRLSVSGRSVLDRQLVHINDLLAVAATEFPKTVPITEREGLRTTLAAPLLREGLAIGAIVIRRTEVRPFSDKQIKLLETFADQAVIAIENVRLFKELQARNRDLTEALEQQTATSEILGVIANSPTDIQPVLNAVAENAARLCDSQDAQIYQVEGDIIRKVASHGIVTPVLSVGETRPISRSLVIGRAILDRRTVHIEDLAAEVDREFSGAKLLRTTGQHTTLATPLLREGVPIGGILIRRLETRPFSEKQIKLLETFAAQAVIAIENVRLFKELEARTGDLVRSVGELKALGEVGQAVSSTLDLQTVLSTIVGHAVQLSGTSGGVIYEYDEAAQGFLLRASYRMEEALVEALRAAPIRLGEGATGRAAMIREPVQVPDTLDEREYTGARLRPMLARLGYRSVLAVPLLREQRILGALTVWRKEAGSFSSEVVNLLQTFATQSALAIQNARLYREIENKSREIEAANRHKSEFLANMSHELRTPLTAIIGFSEVLSDKLFGELNEKQDDYIGDIVSSGRHLLSLINDILDLSKVEAGRMELDVTSFDLPTAIENALILIRERATRHGIKLEHKIDERLGEVVGDERKFKQILLNLLSNAVKFTPEGGSIGVSAGLTKEAVEIAVSDTGIGIAPENQETIFEEFRQVGTDASKKREGTGLGLTLTKKFVELHGGTIWVESAVGKGSTFTFTLPLDQENFDGARTNPDH
jgi:GAF domain-containing protein